MGTLSGQTEGIDMSDKVLIAIFLIMLGETSAAAQNCQDVINSRKSLMKKSGAAGVTATAMIKGEIPFDLTKARAVFVTFAEDVGKMPALFPDCSKNGKGTTAAPAIWDHPDDFKELVAKFAADVKAGQNNTKDLETFKASIQDISRDCLSCHQRFRVRRR
jgi:cytochrome c556